MKEACIALKGEHDFTSFCASDTEVVNKVRTIYDIDIVSCDRGYKLVITGNGFLYNMVRIIMGTLIDIGYGRFKKEDIFDIIEAKDRSRAGHTASAVGLVLLNVQY
jgi:tRNA pseudouridine38-40 synthase